MRCNNGENSKRLLPSLYFAALLLLSQVVLAFPLTDRAEVGAVSSELVHFSMSDNACCQSLDDGSNEPSCLGGCVVGITTSFFFPYVVTRHEFAAVIRREMLPSNDPPRDPPPIFVVATGQHS